MRGRWPTMRPMGGFRNSTALQLAVFYMAGFLAAFNENTVNPILVDAMALYDVSSATANWLVTGYMIVTAVAVTVNAWLCSRFSLRQIVMGGGALLAVGLVGSMAATSFPMLLATRVFQAVGSGIFIPLMMTAILAYAPEGRTGTYLSAGACFITVGPAVSPVVSGAMATWLGWRAVFVIPLALAVLVILAGAFLVHGTLSEGKAAIDVPSVLLIAAFAVALVGGISLCSADGLVGTLLIVAAALFAWLFVRRQGRARNPLLDLAPLRRLDFTGASLLTVAQMMIVFSMSVMLMLYYQGSLGISAAVAGALLLFPVLADSAVAMVAGRIMDAKGPWPLIPLGLLAVVAGQAAVAVGALGGSLVAVVCGSVVTFAGVGLAFSPCQTFGLSVLPPKQNPSGVSLMNLLVQLAASVGPALFVGIMSAVASPHMETAGYPGFLGQGFALAAAVSAVIALGATAFAAFLVRRGPARACQGQGDGA